MTMIFQ